MLPHEIQRALRLITSEAFRRERYFPITALAGMSGLSRETIYQARNGNGITKRVAEALSPLLTDVLEGRIVARWKAGYSIDTVDVRKDEREERQFFPARPMKTTSASRPARDADR